MTNTPLRLLASACGAALLLSGCGGMPSNRSLDSVHQPIVDQQRNTVDLSTGLDGLPFAEQQRLVGWFDALNLGYGDRVAVDDPSGNPATREAIAALAGRRSVLLADIAPTTPGELPPGTARVVVTRFRAHVPGCPDWSAKSDVNLGNATYSNFGCAVNGNLAAMVADPADLVRGASDTGTTGTMSGTKAITSYREAPPTGVLGLRPTSSTAGVGGGTGGGSGP